jgi:PAN domain
MNRYSCALFRALNFVKLIFALSAAFFVSWAALAADNQNRPGSDYDNFNAHSAFVCSNTCGGELKCRAYTYAKPGVQGPNGRCWLKNATPQAESNNCCFSGLHPKALAA